MVDDDFPTPEKESEFYEALGRAVTSWANLEEELFDIAFSILGTTMERAAIVFYRTPNLDSRLTLTDDLVHSFFPKHEPGEHPDPTLKLWREFQTEIRNNLGTRNRLAHHPTGPVVDVYESEDGAEHKIEIRQASYQSTGERLRKRERIHLDPLGIEEIRGHAQIISRLTDQLRNFRKLYFPRPLLTPIE